MASGTLGIRDAWRPGRLASRTLGVPDAWHKGWSRILFGSVKASTGNLGNSPPVSELAPGAVQARKQWKYDVISTVSGVILAVFMWGHVFLVGSIWLGGEGFDWLSDLLEVTWVAQLTVLVITTVFFVHFVLASRKIPGKLQERRMIRNLGEAIASSQWRFTAEQRAALEKIRPHSETSLWIWQVRTGMIILIVGTIHLFVVAGDVIQRMLGGSGITAAESMERVQGGMWVLYVVLLLCVEFHAGIGLYRVFVKWGLGSRIPIIGRITRRTVHTLERLTLWFFLVIGFISLLVLGGVIEPPLFFLLDGE